VTYRVNTKKKTPKTTVALSKSIPKRLKSVTKEGSMKGPLNTYKNGRKPVTKGRRMSMEGLLNARAAMKELVSAKAAAMRELTDARTATENDETDVKDAVKAVKMTECGCENDKDGPYVNPNVQTKQ
jgi:hypothetical protein